MPMHQIGRKSAYMQNCSLELRLVRFVFSKEEDHEESVKILFSYFV